MSCYIYIYIFVNVYLYIYVKYAVSYTYIYIHESIYADTFLHIWRQKLRKERLSWKCFSGVSYFSRSHVIYFQQTETIRGFVWHDVCWWSDPGVPWWRSRPRQSHVYGSGLGGLLYSLCMSFWKFVGVSVFDSSFWSKSTVHLFDGQLVAMLS